MPISTWNDHVLCHSAPTDWTSNLRMLAPSGRFFIARAPLVPCCKGARFSLRTSFFTAGDILRTGWRRSRMRGRGSGDRRSNRPAVLTMREAVHHIEQAAVQNTTCTLQERSKTSRWAAHDGPEASTFWRRACSRPFAHSTKPMCARPCAAWEPPPLAIDVWRAPKPPRACPPRVGRGRGDDLLLALHAPCRMLIAALVQGVVEGLPKPLSSWP
jgi:hypothetical protein